MRYYTARYIILQEVYQLIFLGCCKLTSLLKKLLQYLKIGIILSKLKKRFPVLLILALISVIIFYGVSWARDTINREQNRTLNQIILNSEYGIYNQIVLYLDDFDLGNTSLHGYIHNDVGSKLRKYPNTLKPYDSLGNVTILPIEFTPAYYDPRIIIEPESDAIIAGILLGPPWILNPHNTFNEMEVDIPLNGSETAFPFESYHQTLSFTLHPPDEMELTAEESKTFGAWGFGMPMKFRVHEYVLGYKVNAQTPDLDPNLSVGKFLKISIERPWFIPTLVTIIWLVLTLASTFLLIRALRSGSNREMLVILTGVATLLIAIPAMRFALVPSEISSWTILDMGLVIPAIISLLAVLVAGYYIIRDIPREKSSSENPSTD